MALSEPRTKDPTRVATGRIGAYKLHGLHDSKALTKKANAAFMEKFRREAREAAEARGEKLTEVELERRAVSLRRSHMAALAWAREQARKKKAADPAQSAAPSPAPEGVPSTSAPMPDGTPSHDRPAE